MNISPSSKENLKTKSTELNFEYELFDELTYDQIIDHIKFTCPMGGTDFLIPFNIFKQINEFGSGDIFFLSDGYNTSILLENDIEFLNTFKDRITTLGIGNKNNFDSLTLSKMSKNNSVIEGNSSDIIQQELLAQMSDSTTNEIDNWTDVKIIVCGHEDTLKCGSMMEVERISEEDYNAINYKSNSNNDNLIIEKYKNNFIIKKKETIINSNPITETLYFVVDQSGSMDDSINSRNYNHNSPKISFLEQNENPSEGEYIKYTYKLSNMKHYHRIIFNTDLTKFKGQISWTDKFGNNVSQSLNDNTKYIIKEDSTFDKILSVTNELGQLINISNVCDNDEKIGNFRKINKICTENADIFKLFNDNSNLLNDFSLTELLFFNKKHGMKLYNNTLSPGERNMNQLLVGISSGGGGRALSATATMSSVMGRTPSQQPDYEETNNNKHDMTMCTICYSEIRQYVFSCGHCYSCKDCAEKILISDPKNKCSYCTKDVEWIRKITMNEEQKDSKHYFKCITDQCYNIASIVSECKPIDSEDNGYHLTYCKKCYHNVISKYKKAKIIHNCFCGKEILKIKDKVYFN